MLQFIVPFKDLPKKTLEVSVYDHDVARHDDYIGIILLNDYYNNIKFKVGLFYPQQAKEIVSSNGNNVLKIQEKLLSIGINLK